MLSIDFLFEFIKNSFSNKLRCNLINFNISDIHEYSFCDYYYKELTIVIKIITKECKIWFVDDFLQIYRIYIFENVNI
ncbi:hypothetical protein PNEG_04268 [Pneumocystis murina B123]|uniref:Uncharacterized protein n=1 Tax=Pneumocystis murina (strain B123) TaxID=1069680 RepID=A0A0W4ZX32_PNEMU|nr:hypothetical protein PNEG_04268 [Pneumocystis murina B123]KTW32931.1 hypothetical protein PNEG_04268 [Pneumocystis murina B123]